LVAAVQLPPLALAQAWLATVAWARAAQQTLDEDAWGRLGWQV